MFYLSRSEGIDSEKVMNKTGLLLMLSCVLSGVYAQNNDSNKIVVTDKGTGIDIKLGDSTISFTNEGLYQMFINDGIQLAAEGRYEEAINKFKLSLLYVSNDPEAYYYIGLAYYYLQHEQEALEYLNDALRLDDHHYLSLIMRGIIYSKMELFNHAEDDFNLAISISPENPQGYFNLGISYLMNNETEKACDNLKKAIDLGDTRAAEVFTDYCH